jgi:hypothetical protein
MGILKFLLDFATDQQSAGANGDKKSKNLDDNNADAPRDERGY